MGWAKSVHPTNDELAAFARGKASEATKLAIGQHLVACEPCRCMVDAIAHETPTQSTQPQSDFETSAIPPNLIAHERYHVLELLGKGGMGAVYRAEHRRMERQVALKVMRSELMDRPAMVERFLREVKAAARLAHPNIVTAYDADQAGDTHFLVMEFVEGISLAQIVRDHGALPIAQACAYVHEAALGLQHAYERGMVHRDIKPHNLMRTSTGHVKILDFGLARFAREAATVTAEAGAKAAPETTLTQTGAVMGTADFIAPEQATSPSEADIRADIYSLGCTLYYLLAGHAPFPEGTLQEKVTAHCKRNPVPLPTIRSDISPALVQLVEQMMAKAPSQRYQTPAEVAGALTPFLPDTPRLRRRTRRLEIAAGAALALLLSAATVIAVWKYWSEALRKGPVDSERGTIVAGTAKIKKARRPAPGEGVPAKYRKVIQNGLNYLVATQHEDGHWEADGGEYPTAITALAGMALLMEGSTLSDGTYSRSIYRAFDWLVKQSRPDGLLCSSTTVETRHYMFGHGYALLFLATVYGQEEDGDRRQQLEKILIKAVEFSGNARSENGGWGYVAAAEGGGFDEGASTTIQLQSLRAARNAGVSVPKRLLDIDYLRRSTTPRGGVVYSLFGHSSGDRPPLTAAALACMLTAGEVDSELAKKWLAYCQRSISFKPGRWGGHDEYTHYYYAQALYILGDQGYEKLFPSSNPTERLTWSKYRDTMSGYLLKDQASDGSWKCPLGSVYATTCYLTILQLDNGAVQIYQR
jgi:tRNA A-37 threonylcarbamoyl transferase component Bud32